MSKFVNGNDSVEKLMLQQQENILTEIAKPVEREKRCSPDLLGTVNFFYCKKMVQLEHGLELDKDRFIDLGVKIDYLIFKLMYS